jgi:hypothetical protein
MISDENAVKESTEEDTWAAAAESARGYTFVVWDWKQQIDVEELNGALQKIPGAVVTEVVPPPGTFEDEYVLAVYSPTMQKTPAEWSALYLEYFEKGGEADAHN